MLLGGTLELLLVGWATGRPITNLPLIVLDQDRTAASQLIVQELENTGTFDFQYWANDPQDIQDLMDRGKVSAAVVIPPGFNEAMASGDGKPSLLVLLNGADTTAAQEALRAVDGTAQSIGERLVLRRLGLSAKDLKNFDFSVRVRFNEELTESYYTVPAELALMLEFTILLFAGLAFSRERELGTLEQLLVMPFSSFEIILGKAIPVVIIGFADFTVNANHVPFRIWHSCTGIAGIAAFARFCLSAGRIGKRSRYFGLIQNPTPGLFNSDASGDDRFYIHRLCCSS